MCNSVIKNLKKCQLFDTIESKDLNSMITCMNPILTLYKKNEFVSIEGENLDKLGIIVTGSVAVTKENLVGDRVIISNLYQGETLGEMVIFSDKKVWPATVMALEECEIMYIPPGTIVGQCEKSCISHRVLIQNMLKIISRKGLMLNKKVEYLVMKNLRSKISRFLFDEYVNSGKPYFLISMNRNELADFLNVSRPSLSREMSKMRDEGIIEFHRSSIKINNIDALKKLIV